MNAANVFGGYTRGNPRLLFTLQLNKLTTLVSKCDSDIASTPLLQCKKTPFFFSGNESTTERIDWTFACAMDAVTPNLITQTLCPSKLSSTLVVPLYARPPLSALFTFFMDYSLGSFAHHLVLDLCHWTDLVDGFQQTHNEGIQLASLTIPPLILKSVLSSNTFDEGRILLRNRCLATMQVLITACDG
ncbi:unnamed protein product [Rhizoctonia solani]|uniref:Uncharacterized protein n=1 Tax=Rhizoctonia solani TaxID=456999 RepID=A0A8H3C9T3_9AGAM|nr:unnamed protein product [Rhizoctonia solani]